MHFTCNVNLQNNSEEFKARKSNKSEDTDIKQLVVLK